MSINGKSDVGYILEVDLEYSKELYELHNDSFGSTYNGNQKRKVV